MSKLPGKSVQTTFKFDQRTVDTIDELRVYYGAASKAEVMRKALALLDLAKDASTDGGEIAVVDKDNTVHKVLVR